MRFLTILSFVLSSFFMHAQCSSYYLTWVGVIDNGEGGGGIHGPHGNLHIQLYNCQGKEVAHNILQGPSSDEFIDGDQEYYCLYLGNNECIYYVKIWESDPGPWRHHDMLYEGTPNRAGIWNSHRAANNDAIQSSLRRGANSWARDVWNGGVKPGIPKMFIKVGCGCN